MQMCTFVLTDRFAAGLHGSSMLCVTLLRLQRDMYSIHPCQFVTGPDKYTRDIKDQHHSGRGK